MPKIRLISVMPLSVVLTSMLWVAPVAIALTVPDSGTCASTGNCLQITQSGAGTALVGSATNSGGGVGVNGTTISGTAVWAKATGSGYGIVATSQSGIAIDAEGASPSGTIRAQGDGNGPAILGQVITTLNEPGVKGTSTFGYGLEGDSANNYAVYGHCTAPVQVSANFGVVGLTDHSGTGVLGYSGDGAGLGVQGFTTSGIAGVQGISSSTPGVYGGSSSGNGVFGTSALGQGVAGTSSCGTGGTCIGVYGTSTNGNGVWGTTNSTTNAAVVGIAPSTGLAFYGGGGIVITGSLAQKAGGGSWTAPSDARVKKDVTDFDKGLSDLMRVRAVRFKYNGLGGTPNDGKEYVGVLAQELERVAPEMVGTRMAKLHQTDPEETAIKQVDPSEFTYLLINAVKEQQKVIQRQEARITALEQGRAPIASSVSVSGIEKGVALGFLPVGLVVAIRGRRKKTQE